MKFYVFILFTLTISNFDVMAAGRCTSANLAKAQRNFNLFLKNASGNKDPWTKLRDAFKGNRECMVITETYDFGEAIRKIMITQWERIGGLQKFKNEDAPYYSFVMSALEDETASQNDIKKINKLAEKCPSGASFVCAEIFKLTMMEN